MPVYSTPQWLRGNNPGEEGDGLHKKLPDYSIAAKQNKRMAVLNLRCVEVRGEAVLWGEALSP